jgi:hypothetical protein
MLKILDPVIVNKGEQEVVSKQQMIDYANTMRNKILRRRWLKDADNPPPKIHYCSVVQEGHFTLVTLNDSVTAFSKYNPFDKKVVQLPRPPKSKRGTVGPKKEVSRFNSTAGVNLALHRAMEKFLGPYLPKKEQDEVRAD